MRVGRPGPLLSSAHLSGRGATVEPLEEMDGKSELSRLARDGWLCEEDKRGNGENEPMCSDCS